MKVNVTIDFPSLDRKIVAFHYGDDDEEANRDTLIHFVKREVENALRFFADDFKKMSYHKDENPLRRTPVDPYK